MSIHALLKNKTKNENWSKIFANEADISLVKADTFLGDNIPDSDIAWLSPSDLMVELGTYVTISNIYSTITRATSDADEWVDISGTFIVNNLTAPVSVGTGSTAIIRVNTNLNISYPVSDGDAICGSASSICKAVSTEIFTPSNVAMKRIDATTVDFIIYFPIDISVTPHECLIQFTMKLQTT